MYAYHHGILSADLFPNRYGLNQCSIQGLSHEPALSQEFKGTIGMTSDLGLNVIRGEEGLNPRSEVIAQEITNGKVLVLYHGKMKQNIANLKVV